MVIYCFFEFFGAEASGTTTACINDVGVGADQVEAFGPGGVGDHDCIVHVIDIRANAILHGVFALACNFSASFKGCGIVDASVSEFPAIFRMGFADVNDEELHLVVICFVEIFEADRLTDKGRSCEAAKNKGDGFFCT